MNERNREHEATNKDTRIRRNKQNDEILFRIKKGRVKEKLSKEREQ